MHRCARALLHSITRNSLHFALSIYCDAIFPLGSSSRTFWPEQKKRKEKKTLPFVKKFNFNNQQEKGYLSLILSQYKTKDPVMHYTENTAADSSVLSFTIEIGALKSVSFSLYSLRCWLHFERFEFNFFWIWHKHHRKATKQPISKIKNQLIFSLVQVSTQTYSTKLSHYSH